MDVDNNTVTLSDVMGRDMSESEIIFGDEEDECNETIKRDECNETIKRDERSEKSEICTVSDQNEYDEYNEVRQTNVVREYEETNIVREPQVLPPELESKNERAEQRLLNLIQNKHPGFHPALVLAEIASNTDADAILRVSAAKSLMPYVAPQLKSLEVSGNVKHDFGKLRVSIKE